MMGLAFCGWPAMAQIVGTNADLPHFHQVNPTFYRGAQPTQSGIQSLARQGVKAIINLRAADERNTAEKQWVEAAGLRYFTVPLNGRARPTDAQVQDVLSLIEAPENQPVFLHCKRGKDRTGTIVACYRIAHDQWTGEKALAEAKSLRLAWLELGMKNYIGDFYRRRLPAGNKTIVSQGARKLPKTGITTLR
jgi:uncharacterized protein (TIGR01244 family)